MKKRKTIALRLSALLIFMIIKGGFPCIADSISPDAERIIKLYHENRRAEATPSVDIPDAGSCETLFLYGDSLLNKGLHKQALACYEELLSYSDAVHEDGLFRTFAFFGIGHIYLEEGRYDDAFAIFRAGGAFELPPSEQEYHDRAVVCKILHQYALNRSAPYKAAPSFSEADREEFYQRYAREGYAAVSELLDAYYHTVLAHLSDEEIDTEANRMEEAAAKYKSAALSNEATFLRTLSMPNATQEQIEAKTEKLKDLQKKAQRRKDKPSVYRTKRYLFEHYWSSGFRIYDLTPRTENEDYFRYISMAVKEGRSILRTLSNVSIADYPHKHDDILAVGLLYYYFDDHSMSHSILSQIITDVPSGKYDYSGQRAHISLAINSLSKGKHKPALQHFHSALCHSDKNVYGRIYDDEALAYGGLLLYLDGKNYARPIMLAVLPSLEAEKQKNILEHVYDLGLKKEYVSEEEEKKRNDPEIIKLYDGNRRNGRTLIVRHLESPYISLYLGQLVERIPQGGTDYLEPLLQLSFLRFAWLFIGDAYSQSVVANTEREIFELEAEIDRQQIKLQRNRFIYLTVILLLVLTALTYIIRLYRRKKAAYEALVRRSLHWADPDNELSEHAVQQETTDDVDTDAIEENHRLFACLEEKMQSEKLYLQADMTIEKLASLIGAQRHLLSYAINNVAGKNVSQYLNEYRVKETVRIINAHKNKVLYVEELYEQVGFSSRTSFYRVFKQATGLSPLEFKKNL